MTGKKGTVGCPLQLMKNLKTKTRRKIKRTPAPVPVKKDDQEDEEDEDDETPAPTESSKDTSCTWDGGSDTGQVRIFKPCSTL